MFKQPLTHNWIVRPVSNLANVPANCREATPATVQPFKDGIKGSHWEIFEHSSHMPHVEEQEACMRLVGDFLDDNDN